MSPKSAIEQGLAAQLIAANPDASVWVSANAGAGKTHVLTARIVNLLLRGVRPAAILCLTFTKAASAEMRERLSKLLAEWAVCDEGELRTALRERLGRAPDEMELRKARVLFASVLEAPGGLRIQTIHAFCESLLKRFPLEAGVPPHFEIADEVSAAELLDAAREALTVSDDPVLRDALTVVASAAAEQRVTEALDFMFGSRAKLRALAEIGVEAEIARRYGELGLDPGTDKDAALAEYFAFFDEAAMRSAAEALTRLGTKTDKDAAAEIVAFLAGPRRNIEPWLDVFLTDKRTPRTKMATKKVVDNAPDAAAALIAEQGRVEALYRKLVDIETMRRSAALLRLGASAFATYESRKAARALLDYDDLIGKTVALLEDGAPWVLYKLDGGIEHALVDEAQDTAPEQWRVVRALTGEYFVGEGAVERGRTVFVVGDEKQSIFSFQGADLAAFAASRGDFAARAGAAWRDVELPLSFRSAPAVLEVVDAAFESAAARAGVSTAAIRHIARRAEAGGRVDLWAPYVKDQVPDGKPWDLPVDYETAAHPSARLAGAIARTAKAWIGREPLSALGRAIGAGDILILVRRRNRFFDAMVKALKRENVPVAGADRLVLGEQIAVMDLLSLARFCLLPQDELSLAEALKSPLFGFDDDDLFKLCWGRNGKLWSALRDRAGEDAKWGRAVETLSRLRGQSDYAAPFEFFAQVLGAAGGKAAMLGRLGPDAADPLDEFLAACLDFERGHPPSLQGFLAWFEAGGTDIKRDMERAHGQVRVMTVHGAKGLEAPVVFLPDTCQLPKADIAPMWSADTPAFPLWWPSGGDKTALVDAAKTAARARQIQEYKRLLYVAATRARDRLIVCGWCDKDPAAESWYATLQGAIESRPGVTHGTGIDGTAVVSYERDAKLEDRKPDDAVEMRAASAPPKWVQAAGAPEEPDPPKPLVPSREGQAPSAASPLSGLRADAIKRGALIHRLLQTLPDLPADARADAARRFLARPGHALDEVLQDEIARETLALFAVPDFAGALSGPGLAEAAIVARVGGRALSGRIDRLVVRDDAVFVLDYKTNRPPPDRIEDVPVEYIAQLAAYRAALGPLYPGRPIRAALVWTYAPRLQAIPAALLDAYAP
jgi:ATP-dependent helicase/nuclease subunit A